MCSLFRFTSFFSNSRRPLYSPVLHSTPTFSPISSSMHLSFLLPHSREVEMNWMSSLSLSGSRSVFSFRTADSIKDDDILREIPLCLRLNFVEVFWALLTSLSWVAGDICLPFFPSWICQLKSFFFFVFLLFEEDIHYTLYYLEWDFKDQI